MLRAQLYRITCLINGWNYWGITYAKNKTYLDRFKEHLDGSGGKFLYRGVLEYGRDNFIVELIEEGNFDYIRDREREECLNTLYRDNNGWNGNAGRAVYNTAETLKDNIIKRQKTIQNWTPEQRSKYKQAMQIGARKRIEKFKGNPEIEKLRKQRLSESNKHAWTQPSVEMINGIKKATITRTGRTKENSLGRKAASIKMIGKLIGSKNYSWKGYWVTPFGKFETIKAANKTLNDRNRSIRNHCTLIKRLCQNKSVISKKATKIFNLSEDSIGRTAREVGFDFQSTS